MSLANKSLGDKQLKKPPPRKNSAERRRASVARSKQMSNTNLFSFNMFKIIYSDKYYTTDEFTKMLDDRIDKLNINLSLDKKAPDIRFTRLKEKIKGSLTQRVIFEFKIEMREYSWM
jgi:hypothetical protein